MKLLPLLAATAVLATSAQTPLGGDDVEAFRVFQSDFSPSHAIRIRRQDDRLCDARVDQYTGWLDVGAKHLFFWFFASASATPDEDPLVLWQTGGPGGSSMLGMLEELGPCLINAHGNGTTHNPYGWNAAAHLLFVDQPAGVGFSYLDPGEPVPATSPGAAVDLHVFLQIFTSQVFPALQGRAFHIAGESYGGHYEPTLGAQIVAQNALYPHRPQVALQSLLVGNGFFSPLYSTYGYWETLCTTNPGVAAPVFNATRCDIMAENLPRCMRLAEVCFAHPDPALCAASEQVCWDGVVRWYDGESYKGGRNRFDITQPCVVDDFCYVEVERIEQYLNQPHVHAALGVPAGFGRYHIASDAVSAAFSLTADVSTTTEPEVLFLLHSGVHILLYQGNLDLACNTAGNLKWASAMPWKGQAAFSAKTLQPWHYDGHKAGSFKEVHIQLGDNAHKTRFTFLTVDGAGHMVPQDKPGPALDLMVNWIKGRSYR